MDTIDISPASIDDIDKFLVAQKECGLSEWSREGYLRELDRPDSILLTAKSGGDFAGFLVGRVVMANSADQVEAEIYNIGVLPSFRRLGVGSALLGKFTEACDRKGCRRIWLDVRSSNNVAKSFYRRHGFIRTGTRKSFYTNPTEDADLMCRIVGERSVEQSNQGA